MKTFLVFVLALPVFGITTGALRAGEPAGRGVTPPPLAPVLPDDWEFKFTLYGWAAGVDGTTGVGGFTARTRVKFKDILENLDMAAMMQAEARHGRWMFMLDGQYLKLSGESETPGRLLTTVGAEFEQIMLEATIGYRVWESQRGYVDVFAGARYMNLDATLNFNVDEAGVRSLSSDISREIFDRIREAAEEAAAEARAKFQGALANEVRRRIRDRLEGIIGRPDVASRGPIGDAIRDLIEARVAATQSAIGAAKARLRAKVEARLRRAEKRFAQAIEAAIHSRVPSSVSGSKDWVDPIIGARGHYNFSERFYGQIRADIGGFGVASDFTWQIYAGVGYQISKSVSLELGYRHLDIDYKDGGFTYDTATSGAVLGICIKL